MGILRNTSIQQSAGKKLPGEIIVYMSKCCLIYFIYSLNDQLADLLLTIQKHMAKFFKTELNNYAIYLARSGMGLENRNPSLISWYKWSAIMIHRRPSSFEGCVIKSKCGPTICFIHCVGIGIGFIDILYHNVIKPNVYRSKTITWNTCCKKNKIN